MIKESKYIIKRIIIGVGICLVLGFINSCNVKAYDSSYYKQYNCSGNNNASVGDSYTYSILGKIYKIEYTNESILLNNSITFTSSDYLQRRIVILNPNNSSNVYIYLVKMNNNTQNISNGGGGIYPTFNDYPQQLYYFNGPTFSAIRYVFSNGEYVSNNTISSSNAFVSNSLYNIYATTQQTGYFNTNGNFSGYCLVSKKDSERSNVPVLSSTIESLGIVKNKNQEENVITSYTFNPTFNNFDTTQFNYQYKIGNGDWLGIGISNYTFNLNYNTTVYFRVLRKSDNNVVDSRSITITNIMRYNDNVNDNYNIKYTSENRNVQGNQSAPAKLVDTVVVHFEYYPKQSNLKYQYQYVESGDSLSTWNDMPNNDYDRDYTVNDNGTMYNRILDENDNVLYSSTFTVNSIGMLLNDEDLSWYQNLFGKIDYGSGIGSIFFLPVDLLNVYKTAVESGVCNDYNFGSLFGHNLEMPCLNIRSLVGNNIYNFIDLVGAFCIILALIHFVVDTYDGLMFMNLQDRKEDEKTGRRLL